jgi:hypothetical protein
MHRVLQLLCSAAAVFAPAVSSLAQCGPQWLPGDGIPGIDGTVYAMTSWDPDGPGPREPLIVAGGDFDQAGGVQARNIAVWDPATQRWSALGTGMSPYGPRSLVAMPNGDLIAGGGFTTAGVVAVPYIARWDGTQWSPLGDGLNGPPNALAVLPSGDLVAGGSFTVAGGQHVARWDGAAWHSMGEGVGTKLNEVQALVVSQDGELFVGGAFTWPTSRSPRCRPATSSRAAGSGRRAACPRAISRDGTGTRGTRSRPARMTPCPA